jgi:hypothetical protein
MWQVQHTFLCHFTSQYVSQLWNKLGTHVSCIPCRVSTNSEDFLLQPKQTLYTVVSSERNSQFLTNIASWVWTAWTEFNFSIISGRSSEEVIGPAETDRQHGIMLGVYTSPSGYLILVLVDLKGCKNQTLLTCWSQPLRHRNKDFIKGCSCHVVLTYMAMKAAALTNEKHESNMN